VSAAVRQIRPLLANRGFITPTGVRLRTLADVFAYATAEGLTVRLDGTEIQVRRPRANRPGRRAFVSGKKKQNTIKASLASDQRGRPVWAGAIRPGRMHDQTAVKTEGIDALIQAYPAPNSDRRSSQLSAVRPNRTAFVATDAPIMDTPVGARAWIRISTSDVSG
jgi:hypothetical protein